MNTASRFLRRVVATTAVVAIGWLLASPAPVSADPGASLAVSGLDVKPGVVRFLLTASNLPLNTAVDPSKISVMAGSTALETDAVNVSRTTTKLPARGFMVVLDVSGSVQGARLAAAQAAVAELARTLPDDVQVGLVAVSDKPRLALAPTADRLALINAANKLAAAGGTALYDGVALAQTTLQGFKGDERRIIVLSDGADTRSVTSELGLRDRLRSTPIPVDVVAYQADAKGLNTLRQMAIASNGRVIPAANADRVNDAFRAVAGSFSVVLAVESFVPRALSGHQATLAVTLDLAGADLSTKVQVTFATVIAPPAPSRPLLQLVPRWAPFVFGGAVFLGTLGIVLALAWPGSTKRDRIRQIGLFGPARARGRGAGPAPTTSQIALTALAASAAVVRSRGLESRITLGLEQAGMRLRPPEWLLLRACGAAVGAAFLFMLTFGQGWAAAGISILGGLALGWIATGLYRTARADRRINRFADRLPDALQLVIGSLRSGFSLPQALDSLVNESAEPIASEFGRALAENRLGADLADSLENVVKRTKSDDLAWAVMAVRIQREVGGNLAEVLQTTVDTIRERSRVRRHVRALSAEGRLSAWVLVALPALISALLLAFRRDYLHPLFSEPVGIALLLVGAGLLILGVFWMMRVVRVQT